MDYITLISAEGFEFIVPREAAAISPVIRNMVNPTSGFIEARTGRCKFEDMSGAVLEKVVEYFMYWYRYKDREDVPEMTIPVSMCLEILQAADYLGLDDSKAPGIGP